MKRLILLLSLLFTVTSAPAFAWWQNDWPYRKSITLDTSPTGLNVSGAVGRTVVLVRLHSGNFSFADAADNGSDLRFVAGDDKTPLPYHIETFDKANGLATIWVSVPTLSGGEKQQVWLYYGNKNAPASSDAAGTYDPDYGFVYHFGDGAGTPATDTTANKNNAQNPAAGANDSAIIGRGARFPGGAPVNIAPSASLAIPAGGQFTFSAWIKQDQATPDAQVMTRGPLVVGLAGGVPYVAIGAARAQAQAPIKPADWSHIAVTSDGTKLTLYVNGVEAASAPAPVPGFAEPIVLGASLIGEMDEAEFSKVARPAALLLAQATNQGSADKLIAFGNDEKQGSGGGVVTYILGETPFLDWVIIGFCMVLLGLAIAVMYAKGGYISHARKANLAFLKRFHALHEELVSLKTIDMPEKERKLIEASPLYDLYEVGIDELEVRRQKYGARPLTGEAVEALRSAVDAQQVEENERLDRWMVILTIAISGGPFIGLLGTVMGVMKTFGGVAMAGDVNVNAIAPGIAAALLATIAGLACAIPSLFGYNYLNSRITALTNEMRVFVDRLVTRLAEMQAEAATPSPTKIAAE